MFPPGPVYMYLMVILSIRSYLVNSCVQYPVPLLFW